MNVQVEKGTLERITRKLKGDCRDHIRMGLLVGRVEGYDVQVEDVHVPEQESDKMMARVEPGATASSVADIQAQGKKCVGMITYHGGMPVFESETTRQTRESLPLEGAKCGIVVNYKMKYITIP